MANQPGDRIECASGLLARWLVLALAMVTLPGFRSDAEPGPIHVSESGAYFVDASGQSFYFLADTQWELFRRYSLEDAKLILENRRAKGFTVVMVMLTGVGDGTGRNLDGEHPWLNSDPSPASSSFLHGERWLGFNSIQVWNALELVYPMTLADRLRKPAKPATVLEGVYEKGEEYHFPITPLLVRRQAYYTCLAGGFHGYAHNDSWRVKPGWRAALDDPGAQQMGILKQVFTSLPGWWKLLPDQSVLVNGGESKGDQLNLAASSSGGDWIMAYAAGAPVITIRMTAITTVESASAVWTNPASGATRAVETVPVSGTRTFTRPDGWEDGVLVVKAAKASNGP